MNGPTSSSVPQDGSPQFIGLEESNVLSVLNKAAALTGVFCDVLRRHFSSADRVESPELQSLIWTPGARTKISVESIWRWDPQKTERGTSIIVKRHVCRNQRMGLGGERRQMPASDIHGNPHYASFWMGSHTMFCIGGSGANVEALSTEVSRELHQFGQQVLSDAALLRFGVVEIGEIAQLTEWSDHFCVPVTVGYAFEDDWVVMAQAPVARRASITTILDC